MILKKLFRSDFNDYKIIETKSYNSCGDQISSSFHIEFARYIFGIKFYIDFYQTRCGYGDCWSETITSGTKEAVLREYKNLIDNLPASHTKTYHQTEKICK